MSEIVTLEDLKDSRDGIPQMAFKTKRAGDKSPITKAMLDSVSIQREDREIEKRYSLDYDYEEL